VHEEENYGEEEEDGDDEKEGNRGCKTVGNKGCEEGARLRKDEIAARETLKCKRIKGVKYSTWGRYEVRVTVPNLPSDSQPYPLPRKRAPEKWVGSFETLKEAAEAYEKAHLDIYRAPPGDRKALTCKECGFVAKNYGALAHHLQKHRKDKARQQSFGESLDAIDLSQWRTNTRGKYRGVAVDDTYAKRTGGRTKIRYKASFCVPGIKGTKALGCFATAEDAARVYAREYIKYYGDHSHSARWMPKGLSEFPSRGDL